MNIMLIKLMWRFKDYRVKSLANVEKYVRNNDKLIKEGKYNDIISFYYRGQLIIDPTMDPKCTYFVNPVTFYGDNFFTSGFVKLINEIKK